MGLILAKFRKEKSTQEVLEALQEKIDALETFTVNTQEQKKRIVGNFLAVSIGAYVIAFVVFYFAYFPSTWKERILYFIPLLLFPLIIIQLRYLFTWYFQRKLNKNTNRLTALRAEKKKILEQVMDKETYKVAVNLLARFADKPSKPSLVLSAATPSKPNQSVLSRSLQVSNSGQRSQSLALTPTPSPRITSNYLRTNSPRIISQMGSTTPVASLLAHNSGSNQQLRRRTPFPIVTQQEKGVFDRIVDVLIGDGPQDRFAMICKECHAHNGMALKEDFEYTTFRCAFCNALNPARKARPVAPRLSVMPAPANSSDSSDSDDDKTDTEEEPTTSLNANTTQYSTPINNSNSAESGDNENTAVASLSFLSSETDEENIKSKVLPPTNETSTESERVDNLKEKLLKQSEKFHSAIDDAAMGFE